MKINLATVRCLKEAEARQIIDAPHGRDRRAVMGLDLALHPPRLFLETPPRPFECIVYRDRHVGMTVGGAVRAADIDFPALRQGEADTDFISAAAVVALARGLDGDAAGRHAAKP